MSLWKLQVFDAAACGIELSLAGLRVAISGHAPSSPFLTEIPQPDTEDLEMEQQADMVTSAKNAARTESQHSTSLALARTLLLYAILLVQLMRQQQRAPPGRKRIEPSRLPPSWYEFFTGAGFTEDDAERYGVTFVTERVRLEDLDELDVEYLKNMGITLIGHQMMIMKHRNSMYNQ